MASSCNSKACPAHIPVQAGIELVGTFMLCTLLYLLYSVLSFLFYMSNWHQLLFTGLIYGVVLAAFSGMRWAHLNPAVTLASALTNRISWLSALIYMLMQVLGAGAAGLLLPWIAPSMEEKTAASMVQLSANGLPDHGLYTNQLSQNNHIEFSVMSVVILETLIAVLIVATAMTFTDKRARMKKAYPLAMAAAYTVGAVVLYPISGAGMNPARSTGIILAQLRTPFAYNPSEQLWVFWFCPFIGAAIVALLMIVKQIAHQHVAMKAAQKVRIEVQDEDDADIDFISEDAQPDAVFSEDLFQGEGTGDYAGEANLETALEHDAQTQQGGLEGADKSADDSDAQIATESVDAAHSEVSTEGSAQEEHKD